MSPLRPSRPSRSSRRARLVAACVAVALAGSSLTAAAGVSAAPLAAAEPSPAGSGKEVLRERTLPLDTAPFRGLCSAAPFGQPREHSFDFFDDVCVTAVEDGLESEEGTVTWSGHAKGSPEHSVVLSMRGLCTAGSGADAALEAVADLGTRVYRMETIPGRPARVRITEEDPSHREPHAPDDDVMTSAPASRLRKSLEGRAPATVAAPVVIDVIAGYTRQAVTQVGGVQQVVDTIRWSERKMNEALADSGVPASIDIIGTYDTGYGGDNTSSTMFKKLSDPRDPELGATAAGLRDRYGADLITVVNRVGPGQSSGQGSLPTSGRFNPSDAFSVVDIRSMTDWYNLGHEIGHNLGLFHDRTTLNQQAPDGSWQRLLNAPFATGWVTPRHNFHTLMAYSSACGMPCTAVNQYSNTENSINGQPLGDANNNNAAMARLSAPVLAGYRKLTFARTRYPLTLDSTAGGSTRPAVYGPYAPGTVVAVTAYPQAGYRHAGWIYDGVQYTRGGQVNVTMNSPHKLTAVFVRS
ncbi:M12 family metallo-peptidase [Streptomyces sp. CG1]|uniref:InlB B-repeat-containing protein n=1 Tax=Streptomyces sp. CG1 TaxID=1287523 RepID=UPI0034E25717